MSSERHLPNPDDRFNWNREQANAVLLLGMALGSAQSYMSRSGEPARHGPRVPGDKSWWPLAKKHLQGNPELLDACALWYQAVYLMSDEQVTDVPLLVRFEWLEWFLDYTTSQNVFMICLGESNYKDGLKDVFLRERSKFQQAGQSANAWLDDRRAQYVARVVRRTTDMYAFSKALQDAQQLD